MRPKIMNFLLFLLGLTVALAFSAHAQAADIPVPVSSWMRLTADIAQILIVPILLLMWSSQAKLRRDLGTQIATLEASFTQRLLEEERQRHKLELTMRDRYLQKEDLQIRLQNYTQSVELSIERLRTEVAKIGE